ncbi:prefoldin chaperone subunit family protein isoform X1 [Zea mays]|uniref:Prefoldin chaperone subunit family protein n=1 Tax=Zea mays TaxID=4577 RepID=A0A1D6HYT2_MAIZE|nr:prefoldin chaperone subunit family protein isoform X1 [Zea mays]ONM53277.1 Prefoldin chaperone subunit family protein [Zea mays]|eukprot:XP_008652329.1 prefoldin chaperone subunit family protein isoform X1 [Zea mays]
MATAAAGLAPAKEVVEKKVELLKEIRAHEVAIAELDNLNPSRAVYQKAGNIFFRKSVKSVITTEQSNRYSIASLSSYFLSLACIV